MSQDSIKNALSVLEAEKVNLSPEQRVWLAELLKEGENIRNKVSEKLKTKENRELSPEQKSKLFATLEARFKSKPKHYKRIEGVDFNDVKRALEANPEALYSLSKMEETGGEPDVAGADGNEFIFEDRSKESPSGRRDLNAYQAAAQADEFGVGMQSPDAYKAMKKTGEYDLDSGSWLETDPELRKTGGAILGRRIGDGVSVLELIAGDHLPSIGWRGVLRVKKV